jgi:hypothetical protein
MTSEIKNGVEICTDFSLFAKSVLARFNEMSNNELYVTAAENLFDAYLAAFPDGTNPVFRKRAYYDCATCKQFVRRLGNLVNIKNGKPVTVWGGLTLPHPYQAVADALDEAVRSAKILTVFRTKEKKYGEDHNYDSVTKERHDHFYGVVAARHYTASPDTSRGEQEAIFQVCSRGLSEIRMADLETVIDLINENGLYRGGEHKTALEGFTDLLRQFSVRDASADPDGRLFVWEHLSNRNARFRNTVIGTLLTDLAEGKDLEQAVKAFETKVAPANYKRPAGIITQRQVEEAVQTLTDLGLHGAIGRRYAKPSDVSVNDVLFVDNDTRGQMKDGVAALLADSVKKSAPDLSRAVTIPADQFVKEVLTGAKSLELFLENRHQGNFVSLTGADGPERLFKWNNNFAWSYDGDLADSALRRRVQELGGRVDGVLRFSHRWNYDKRNASLMDLHVFMPGCLPHKDGCHDHYPVGQRVGWNQRQDHESGGTQDVDYVQAAPPGYIPVENITFPTMSRLKEGVYTFKIHNWSLREPTQGGFQAEIEFGGQTFQYEVIRPLKQKEWVTVATATLKNGMFTITHVLPSAKSSQDKWGVKTETLLPVAMACYSPNHWGDNSVGAKHLIFALKGCRNPGTTRGIYNEFLDTRLESHRRVFEVLGAKTKCPYSDEQISGVGFTAARGDSVTVVVDGKRAYTLAF